MKPLTIGLAAAGATALYTGAMFSSDASRDTKALTIGVPAGIVGGGALATSFVSGVVHLQSRGRHGGGAFGVAAPLAAGIGVGLIAGLAASEIR